MAYRNKTYVCFDADSDIRYYRLMQAWKQNDNTDYDFYNAHNLNTINPEDSEETKKRKLRERLKNSKIFIVLVGEKTKYQIKYVRWEIETAIDMGLPIIVSNLNDKRDSDSDRCPPILKEQLAIHVSFNAKIIQYALENWGDSHAQYSKEGKTGSYRYKESVYSDLGL
jgi:hypothetical protein